eukprot:770421_1
MSHTLFNVELTQFKIISNGTRQKYTEYTFTFKIGHKTKYKTHSISARYSKLYKLNQSLLKHHKFHKLFKYNPPKFPPKGWFTDYTKSKNYTNRGNALLSYFKQLIKNHALKLKYVQKILLFPKSLRIYIDWIYRIEQTPPLPSSPSNSIPSPLPIPIPFSGRSDPWYTLRLKELEPVTKASFMDVNDIKCKDVIYYNDNDYNVDNIYLFPIDDILPKHLMDEMDYSIDNNIDKKLLQFKMMSKTELNEIDDIAIDAVYSLLL